MLQKRKNISIAGLYVCPNSIFWVTGALYCACFTDPGDGGYNDFITGERKKSRNEHKRSKMGEQEKRRQYLIQALLRERPEYEAMEIPMQEDEQRQLLRGLMNIRAPRRCSEEFLRIQDAYCAGKADGETLRIASVLLLVLSGTGIGIRAGKCGVLLYIHWGILLSERQGGADCRTDGTGVFGGDS